MGRQIWIFVLVLAALAAGAWLLLLQSRNQEQQAPVVQPQPAPTVEAIAPVPPASTPVAQAAPPPAENPLGREDIAAALESFIGRKAVATYLQIDDFPRRLVATVDNLGRSHAPPALWPVHPTPGRFTVDGTGESAVIAPDNAARYTPLVLLVETIDAGNATELYLRMYPLLQREYRQLGFPDREFNQRLLEVIAQLLATPEPEQPPRVQLVEVKGPVPSVRPWVRYEYADPALESLSAGQKILLRVGIANERRLKKKLGEFRGELLKRSQAR